ncbi:ras guanine nucleotide exchange factor E-like [Actinia tenebrosa]|uniref:Ras guanine nucleotide exchange factor E-like n=1 Tax=Actinia tenebrosa TaxID=6105 RepID=A0A6P8J5H8_ACTTE|nr:ras guanine nucleotide exchange factor E-like [Actinia tenebrosa]
MFGKIGLDEILDQRWKSQERGTCSPNVSAMAEFYSRMVAIVTTEILAHERPGQRARVIAKVIEMADRCAEIHNYNATKALVTSLRSPPVYRLQHTWKKLKHKSKSMLRHLIILTSSSDDYALYYRHRLACKNNTNSLHFLGDVLGQMNYIQSVYSEDEVGSNHACADVSTELQDVLYSYRVAAEGYSYPRHPGVAKLLMKTAEVKTLVENYDLSLEREPENTVKN